MMMMTMRQMIRDVTVMVEDVMVRSVIIMDQNQNLDVLMMRKMINNVTVMARTVMGTSVTTTEKVSILGLHQQLSLNTQLLRIISRIVQNQPQSL